MSRPDAVAVIRELIEQGLRRRDPAVVRSAVHALAALDDPAAREALWEFADRADAPSDAIEALAAGGAKGIADWLLSDGPQAKGWRALVGPADRWRLVAGAAERGIAVDGSQIPFLRKLRLSFALWGQTRLRPTVNEVAAGVIFGALLSLLLISPLLPDALATIEVRLRGLYLGFIHAFTLVVLLAPLVRTLDWRLGGWAFGLAQMAYAALAGIGAILIVSFITSLFDSKGQLGVMHSWWLTLTTILVLMIARAASFLIARESVRSRPLARLCQALLAMAGAGVILSVAGTMGNSSPTASADSSQSATSAAIGLAAMVASASILFVQTDHHPVSVGRGSPPIRSRLARLVTLVLAGLVLAHWVGRAWHSHADPINPTAIEIKDAKLEHNVPSRIRLQVLSPFHQHVTLTAIGAEDIRIGVVDMRARGSIAYTDYDTPDMNGERVELELEAGVMREVCITTFSDDCKSEQTATTAIDWSAVFGQGGKERDLDRALQFAVDEMSLASRPSADNRAGGFWSDGGVKVELAGDLRPEEIARIDDFDAFVMNPKRGAFRADKDMGQFGVVLKELAIGPPSSSVEVPGIPRAAGGSTSAVPSSGRLTVSEGALIYARNMTEDKWEILVTAGRASTRRFAISAEELKKSKNVAWDPLPERALQGLTWSLRKAKRGVGHHIESIGAAEVIKGNRALATFYIAGMQPSSESGRPGEQGMLLRGLGGQIEGSVEVLDEHGDLLRVRPLNAWWRGSGSPPQAACFEIPRSRLLQASGANDKLVANALKELAEAPDQPTPTWSNPPTARPPTETAVCMPARRHLFFSQDANEDGLYELELSNTGPNEARSAQPIGPSGVGTSTVGLTNDPRDHTLIGSAWRPLLRMRRDGTPPEEFGVQGAEGLAMDPQYRVLYASINERFLILDAERGTLVAELKAPWEDADCVTLDERGRVLYALSDEGLISFNIDTHESKRVGNQQSGGASQCGLAFDPISRQLFASALGDDAQVLWSIDPETGQATQFATFDIELKGGLTIVIE